MNNTIKAENGIFTVNYFPNHYKIKKYSGRDTILNAEYSLDSFVVRDEGKIENIFKEFEPQIIQIMKFFINENIKFYKHFDIDFTLIGKCFFYTIRGDFTSNYYLINWSRFLKSELKRNNLAYLQGLTEEQKRTVNIYTNILF